VATVERREQAPGKIRYRVRWWADGKQRSKTFARSDEARRFKAVLEGDHANGSYRDPRSGAETLATFVEGWLPTVVDLRPTTRARLESCLRTHVLPEFGNLPLSGVTNAHVNLWVSTSLGKLSAASVRKNAFALRRVLEAALDEGKIRVNPAAKLRLPAETKHEQHFLTKDEALRLADCIDPRYRALVLLAVFGGLRFGELTALKRDCLDVARCTVRVRETLVDVNNTVHCGPPKTKSSLRTVTVPRSVMRELQAHMLKYSITESNQIIFTNEHGQPVRRAWWRKGTWLPATKAAGLEGLRPHDLRHTFVALWVMLGRNAKEVSKVAGHSSVAFTLDRYGHLYEVDDEGLADRLDALI